MLPQGTSAPLLSCSFTVSLHLVHDDFPRARGCGWVARREIGSGNLKIQSRLPNGFIPRIEQELGLVFVFGSKARLFSSRGVFAVEHCASPKQEKHGFMFCPESCSRPASMR
jgi:hypothetical protein